jgi:hypothetical protein
VKLRLVLAIACAFALSGCLLGSSALKVLAESTDAKQRASAAEQLGKSPASGKQQQKVVEALVQATMDVDTDVRTKAVEALGKLGGDDARQALVDVLAGKQYARAALKHYSVANGKAPDQPEILMGLARAQTDLGKLSDAEKSLEHCVKVVKNLDENQGGRFWGQISGGYTTLRMALEKAGDKQALERVAKIDAEVEEKVHESQRQGGGGMGGMFGGGFPGGAIPITQ